MSKTDEIMCKTDEIMCKTDAVGGADATRSTDAVGDAGAIKRDDFLKQGQVLQTQGYLSEEEQPETTGKTYGYARVSSRDQNLDRQLDAFAEFGIEEKNIYADKASGKDFNRPRYKTLIRKLRPGDVVVIKSIDRLGRNYEEIIDEWRHITKKRKAAIVVLDMPLLDTRVVKGNLTGVFIADIMLQLLSYVAQIERENTKQRQAEGIAAAQARGVKFGRPRIKKPGYYPHVRSEFLAGRMTRREAADLLGVSPATFDNWMKE